jgi:hypothetical protein
MAGTHSPWAAGDAGAGPSRGVAAPPPPPREEQEHELAPLVIVEGFLCAASSFLWGEFAVEMQLGEQHRRAQRAAADGKRPQHPGSPPQAPRRVIWAPIGPVSSIHDRACELFYSLRGGTVDYGAAHAAEHGHGRWGRSYPPQGGAYAAWSAERPVHLVGHSLGGATILKLRSLLNAGFFDDVLQIETPAGEPSRAAYMVRSITTISSPLRGTPLVYLLGEQPSPSPAVRFLSAGDMLAKTVHLAVFLRAHFAAARRVLPDPQADAWAFSGARSHAELVDSSIGSTAQAEAPPSVSGRGWSWRAGWGLPSLLGNLWRSEWAEGRDCAPWDCTLGERARCEQEEPEAWIVGTEQGRHAPTWFRSFACVRSLDATFRPAETDHLRTVHDRACRGSRHERERTSAAHAPAYHSVPVDTLDRAVGADVAPPGPLRLLRRPSLRAFPRLFRPQCRQCAPRRFAASSDKASARRLGLQLARTAAASDACL